MGLESVKRLLWGSGIGGLMGISLVIKASEVNETVQGGLVGSKEASRLEMPADWSILSVQARRGAVGVDSEAEL